MDHRLILQKASQLNFETDKLPNRPKLSFEIIRWHNILTYSIRTWR